MTEYTDFIKESMSIYMEKYKNYENPHKEAMIQISKDWKEYKNSKIYRSKYKDELGRMR